MTDEDFEGLLKGAAGKTEVTKDHAKIIGVSYY